MTVRASADLDFMRASFVPYQLVRVPRYVRHQVVSGSATYRDDAGGLHAVGPGGEIGPEALKVVAGEDGLETIVIAGVPAVLLAG